MYKLACESGMMWTWFDLGILYANGDGVGKTKRWRRRCIERHARAAKKMRATNSGDKIVR